jgi:hypothetical protein
LTEIENEWSFQDLLDGHEMLAEKREAERAAQERK